MVYTSFFLQYSKYFFGQVFFIPDELTTNTVSTEPVALGTLGHEQNHQFIDYRPVISIKEWVTSSVIHDKNQANRAYIPGDIVVVICIVLRLTPNTVSTGPVALGTLGHEQNQQFIDYRADL